MDVKSPEKHQDINEDAEAVDYATGHLQELEVDVDKVVHEKDMVVGDDADTSPYPEGANTQI